MMFRVGINMGDVIVEGDNLYGDGVNVAARLEALSQPGGVCLSKSVHDFVSQKVDLNFDDIGEQRVKNTDVWAYDVQMTSAEKREIEKRQLAAPRAKAVRRPSPFCHLSTSQTIPSRITLPTVFPKTSSRIFRVGRPFR